MTTEDKELLLNDLCARLPYGVQFEHKYGFDTLHTIDCYDMDNIEINSMEEDTYRLEDIRPCLIPLRDVNETLKKEFSDLFNIELDSVACFIFEDEWDKTVDTFNEQEHWIKVMNLWIQAYSKILTWCYKYHIDVNGLIDKNLAVAKK